MSCGGCIGRALAFGSVPLLIGLGYGWLVLVALVVGFGVAWVARVGFGVGETLRD